jgi:hypothetical protein
MYRSEHQNKKRALNHFKALFFMDFGQRIALEILFVSFFWDENKKIVVNRPTRFFCRDVP